MTGGERYRCANRLGVSRASVFYRKVSNAFDGTNRASLSPMQMAVKILFGEEEAERIVVAVTAGLDMEQRHYRPSQTTPEVSEAKTNPLSGRSRVSPWSEWGGSDGEPGEHSGPVTRGKTKKRGQDNVIEEEEVAQDEKPLGSHERRFKVIQRTASVVDLAAEAAEALAEEEGNTPHGVKMSTATCCASAKGKTSSPSHDTSRASVDVGNDHDDSPSSGIKRRRVSENVTLSVASGSHCCATEVKGVLAADETKAAEARASPMCCPASPAASTGKHGPELGTARLQAQLHAGDSEAMMALRKTWAQMQPLPQVKIPQKGLQQQTDQQQNQKQNQKHRAAHLKQRLKEVLVPVVNPTTREWTFKSRVTSLNLANASIGPQGAKFIARALLGRQNGDGTWVYNTALRSLNLQFNSIGDEGMIAIAQALSPLWVDANGVPVPSGPLSSDVARGGCAGKWVGNTTMQVLNVNFCDIGPAGGAALAALITPCFDPGTNGYVFVSGVTTVSVFNGRLGEEGARLFGEALAPRCQPSTGEYVFNPNFVSLNIGRNQIGDAGLAHIARALRPVQRPDGTWAFNPTFKHLYANMNSCMSQVGPLALGDALRPRHNPCGGLAYAASLATLHLANVMLGEEGGRAIASIIAPHQVTQRTVDAAGGEVITHTWVFPSAMRVLNLQRTGLGDAGLCHIAEALQPRWCPKLGSSAIVGTGQWVFNSTLRELHISGATIGPEGAKALARAITPQRNNSGNADAQSLKIPHASQWSFNRTLQVLDLRDNFIGREGVEALAAALEPVPVDVEYDYSGSTNSTMSDKVMGEVSVQTQHTWSREHGSAGFDLMDVSMPSGDSPDSVSLAAGNSAEGGQPRQRWIPGGGALAVLNMELNDAGPEAICSLAAAIAPRWCSGKRPEAPSGETPSIRSCSPVSNDTTSTAWFTGMSPGSSNTSSPAITPRGGATARRSRLGGVDELACVRAEPTGYGCECGDSTGTGLIGVNVVGDGEGYWVVNRSLRALGVGGNRMGNEGAHALAAAIEPRQNSDGTWVTPLLHHIDASDNVIGSEGLLALARAVQPKCVRCHTPFSRTRSGELSALLDSRGCSTVVSRCSSPCGDRLSPPSGMCSPRGGGNVAHGMSLRRTVLTSNAAVAPRGADVAPARALCQADSVAAGVAARLLDGFCINDGGKSETSTLSEPASEGNGSMMSQCAFDIHSAIRRLDLMHNQPDEETRELFQRLRSVEGSPCEVNI